MKANRKILFLMVLPLFVLLFFTGCSFLDRHMPVVVLEPSEPPVEPEDMAKRFIEPTERTPTAVESAIELSGKYAELSRRATELRYNYEQLSAERKQLKVKNISLESQLQQTEKELNEANELLIEMRVELNNWKTDVLGFRSEMRQADSEQLRALLKILELLGGEVRSAAEQGDGNVQYALGGDDNSKLESQADAFSGGQNE